MGQLGAKQKQKEPPKKQLTLIKWQSLASAKQVPFDLKGAKAGATLREFGSHGAVGRKETDLIEIESARHIGVWQNP